LVDSTGFLYCFEIYSKPYQGNREQVAAAQVFEHADDVAVFHDDDERRVRFDEANATVAEPFGAIHALVMRLMDQLPQASPYRLFVDRFYTSVVTARVLLLRNIYLTGTIMSNRSGLPPQLLEFALAPGAFRSSVAEPGIGLVSWKDTTNVLLLSTAISPSEEGTIQKKRRGWSEPIELPAPAVAVLYRSKMGSVDHHDQHLSYYNTDRRSIRWWMKLGHWLLDATIMCVVLSNLRSIVLMHYFSSSSNTWVIYCTRARMDAPIRDQKELRLLLADQLIGDYCSRQRAGRPPSFAPTCRSPMVNRVNTKAKRCQLEGCPRSSVYGCITCHNTLCPDSCFQEFHN
jgi:hypothetical protein